MSARRGAHIGSHWNTNYLLDLGRKKTQENIVHKKLKHLDDVIFRVLAFGVGVIKWTILACPC